MQAYPAICGSLTNGGLWFEIRLTCLIDVSFKFNGHTVSQIS